MGLGAVGWLTPWCLQQQVDLEYLTEVGSGRVSCLWSGLVIILLFDARDLTSLSGSVTGVVISSVLSVTGVVTGH